MALVDVPHRTACSHGSAVTEVSPTARDASRPGFLEGRPMPYNSDKTTTVQPVGEP